MSDSLGGAVRLGERESLELARDGALVGETVETVSSVRLLA
jgi:hypothetical protein